MASFLQRARMQFLLTSSLGNAEVLSLCNLLLADGSNNTSNRGNVGSLMQIDATKQLVFEEEGTRTVLFIAGT